MQLKFRDHSISTFGFPILLLSLASLYALYRCTFGVDLTDEAQYVGEAYSSLIGGAPFQTDLFIQQMVSVLLIPFTWAYTQLVGNSNGIVLFFRLLWWTFATLAAITLFFRIKKSLVPIHAALIAATLVVFVPFNIPSPSYNSFGILFLVLGLCTKSALSLSQLSFLTLATIAYPPFLIALVGLLLKGLIDPVSRKEALKKTGILAIVGIALAIIGVLAFGLQHLRDALHFSSSFGTFGTQEKLFLWKTQANYVLLSPEQTIPFLWLGLIFFVFSFVRKFRAFYVLPLFIFLLLLPVAYLPHHYWIILIAFIGLPISLSERGWLTKTSVLLAMICGLLSGWASSNGLPNAAIGIFPAFLASLMAWSEQAKGRREQWLMSTALGILLVGFVLKSHEYVYRDEPIPALNTRVEWGPYQGLRTTPERAYFLDEIQRDIVKLDDGKSSILFFYSFPAGYLMSTMKPQTRMLFLHDREYSETIKKYLLPSGDDERPDYVVRPKLLPGLSLSEGDSSLNTFFSPASGYNLVVDQPNYFILKKGT